MKTLTLKLTKAEWVAVKETYLYHPIFLNDDGLLEIDNVDAFKEYLNDWFDTYKFCDDLTNPNLKNLKSILSKLESAETIKENIFRNVLICEKCDGKGYPYQDDNIDCDECYGTGRELSKVSYDYDGDCNYCDDSNCTNGECK